MELGTIKDVALAAAARGGEILRSYWGKQYLVKKKGAKDLVTEADLASEKAIIGVIRSSFPDHGILAEEAGSAPGTTTHTWVIDPLDGTTNYAHGLPEFCLSIAWCTEGQPVFGVVLNPVSGELFCGEKGNGATLNGRPIHVSAVNNLKDSLLVTGFPYDVEPILASIMGRLQRCILAAQGLRRLGSAALDLCYVACGRFDGFWEQNLSPWDTAAGFVIATEAGATVSDFYDGSYHIDKKEILATNGLVHQQMLSLLRE